MAKTFKPSLTLKQFSSKNGTRIVEGETVPLDPEEIKTAYEEFVAKEKEEHEDDVLEASEDGDVALSFPPNPRKDRDTKILRGKWRDQKRIKCSQPKCCYPLNVIMEKGNRQKIEVPAEHEHEGEVAYKAECSWDPRHTRPEDGSEQYVTHNQLFPPDDVADEDLE
jgi:hypothetical protein